MPQSRFVIATLAVLAMVLVGLGLPSFTQPETANAAPGDPQTISGTVWNDLNLNQAQELGTNVLDQADTSQAGTNLYGDPTVPGAGVEDVLENVTVCLRGNIAIPQTPPPDLVVAADRCTTTDAAGIYEFDLSDIDPTGAGTGNLRIIFDAPAGFRFTSPAPTGDNDADEQASAPTPPDPWRAALGVAYDGSAAAGITDLTDAGMRPVPEIKLAYLDLNAIPGDGIQGIETGTPNFNTEGNCTSTDPLDPLQIDPGDEPPTPGDDCHKFDDTVRTNDVVTITPSLTMDNAPPGGIDDVILEMQFFPVNGADIDVVSAAASGIPTSCLTSGVNPASSVTKNPDGSIILICNLGNVENAQLFAPISIKPTGNSPNGSSFTTEIRAYAADNDAIPSEELEAPEIAISGAPKFDITKNSGSATSPPNRVINGGENLVRLNPATGVSERGRGFQYDISIVAGGDAGKGITALQNPITFDEIIDPAYAANGAHVFACYPQPYPTLSPLPWDGNGASPFLNDRTSDNGAWSCSNNGSSNTITITNADTSGQHYPTNANNGAPTAPWKYVVTGRVLVWYPNSAFYKSVNPAWDYGDAAITGTYPITNCVGNFDPDSINDLNGDTTSNYNDDFEPGWDGAAPTGNNCRNHSHTISIRGSFWKRYGGDARLDNGTHKHANAPTWSWACTGTPDQLIVPGQTACDTGDGPVVADQFFSSEVYLLARNSEEDLADPRLCEAVDNQAYRLAPIPVGAAAGDYGFLTYRDVVPPGIDGSAAALGYVFATNHGFTLEYARFTALSGRKTWQIDHNVGPPDPVDGSIPLSNPDMQLAVKDCGDGLTAAGDLEWTSDPVAAGWSADDLVMVRSGTTPGTTLQLGDDMLINLHFQARSNFYSPDFPVEDGQPLESGTLLPNQSNFGYDRDGDGIADMGTAGYDASDHKGIDGTSSVGYGDRLIFQSVIVSIEKGAYQAFNSPASTVGDDDTAQVFAGDPIMWSLKPAVTAINNLAVAKDVEIRDVLPPYTTYNASCTPPPPAGVSGPTVIPNTPNPGETTLIWSYANDLPANVPLPAISVCADTSAFAPAPVDVVNEVVIEASNVTYTPAIQEDDRTVRLLQRGRFAVRKSVDFPLDFQDDLQVWTLEWANTSDQIPFAPADIIDVFPFNGDGPGALAGRDTYASSFNGDVELQAIPAAPQMSGGTTGVHSDTGQWYATCDLATTISPDASDATRNAIPGGTTNWIAVPTGSTADPSGTCALADVTSIRWVSADVLAASELGAVSVTLKANANAPNDLYVNRFTGYSPTFLGKAVKSNEPFVQVIGFSIGDVVWLDVDGDGVFTAADTPAPAGTAVELFNAAGVSQGTTTTDADGRYIFEGVSGGQYAGGTDYVAGQYYVEVTGLPTGWAVDGASATFEADPNTDLNEDTDHHSTLVAGTVTSSGLLELSASVDLGGLITGDEPTGENVKFLGDPLVRDDLSNLTLDLMLTPLRGDIKVIKTDDEGNLLEGWTFSVLSTDTAECPLPSSLTNPALTDTDGEALFEDLMIYGATTGELCEYNVVETIQPGWIQLSQTPAGPHTLDPDVPVEVTAVNLEVDAAITIEKSTNNNDADAVADADWIAIGAPITWEYVVTNTGNVDLADVVVSDDQGVTVTCPAAADADGDGDIDLLAIGAANAVTCTATGVAADSTANTNEAYANIGKAVGTPTAPNGDEITTVEKPEATDPSHYLSGLPSIAVVKKTNGNDANTPADADWIAIGAAVAWTYEVKNDGTVDLADVMVTDDQGVAITCPATADTDNDGDIDLLLAGTTVICTGAAAVAADTTGLPGGVYKNTATATGNPVDENGDEITEYTDPEATDPSHYFSGLPAIELEKSTNNNDADTAAAADWLAIGTPITWRYVVKNSGTVDLADVAVTDDQIGAITCPASVDADGDGKIDLLAAGASVTCTATGVAADSTANTNEAYANIGTATGNPVDDNGDEITEYTDPEATDPSHYLSGLPKISVEKATNTIQADTPADADWLAVGTPITWEYVVKNEGTVDLANVTITDDQIGSVTCPVAADPEQDGTINLLAAGASVTCTVTGTNATDTTALTGGVYKNIATATGTPVDENGDEITEYTDPSANDPSHYISGVPAIEIVKKTNGNDANTPADADWLAIGDDITWTFEVKNSGTVDLADVVVSDDQLGVIACPAANDADADGDIDLLAAGTTVTCTKTVPAGTVDTTANADQAYANIGKATGTPVDPDGDPIAGYPKPEATDPSHYKAGLPSITIEKETNGNQADDPTDAQWLIIGDQIIWKYGVKNNGTVDLADVVVTDDQGLTVTCPATADTDGDGDIDLLVAGTSVICEAVGTVTDTTSLTDGVYANIGSATGTPVDENGDPITEYDPPKADDPSHYQAGSAGLEIVKKTNGNDANTPADAGWLLVGDTVTWTYRVTNTGSVDLADVVITDDQGVAVTCLAIRDTDGDGDIDLLAVGQSVTCTGSGPAVDTTAAADQAYANVGSATGTPVDQNGDPITALAPPTASDPSHYKAGTTGIEVRKDVLNPKTGKWQAADDESAAIIHEVGTTAEYRITVTNTGTVALDNVVVADPVLPQCAKAIGTLAPGAEVSHTCTHNPVVFGFKNTAAATGAPALIPHGKVIDTDPAFVRVVRPRLAITKKGPKKAKAGSTITYILEVKNTGNGIARDVVVVDALPPGLVLAANSAQRRALKVAQAQRTKANRDIARLRRSSKSVSTASKARTTRLLKKAITRRNVAKKRVVKLRSRVSNYPFTLVRGNVVWKVGDIKAGKKKRIIVKAKAGKSLKGRIINRAQVGAGNSTRCPVPTAKNAFALRRANAATSCTAKKPTIIIGVAVRVTPAVTG